MKCITLPDKLIILGKKELSKDDFKPVKNRQMFTKPLGGLWASPYTPDKEFISGWHEWCHYNMDEWVSNDAVIVTLKDDTRYWCIDDQEGLKDLIDIVGEYETELSKSIPYKMAKYINFESASQTFDTIYLTEKGACETHIPIKQSELNLYGWDCESVLIMNFDMIESWEYIKLDIVKENK